MHETHSRLATIMFVQITEPAEDDSEMPVISILSLEDIESLCAHIKAFHGDLVDVRAGELFAHFPGARVAYSAASALLLKLPQFSLRIGLHLGEVPVLKGRFQGVDVNLASRLPDCVNTGGICVSQNVYQYLDENDQQQLIALGSRELKNIEKRVPLYASLPADGLASHSKLRGGFQRLLLVLRKYHRYLLILFFAWASGFAAWSHHKESLFSEQNVIHIYLPVIEQQVLSKLARRKAGSIEMTIRSRLAEIDEIHLTNTRSNALYELLLMHDHTPGKLRIGYTLNNLSQGSVIETGVLEAEDHQLFHLQDMLSDHIYSALSQHKIIHSSVASFPVKAKLGDR